MVAGSGCSAAGGLYRVVAVVEVIVHYGRPKGEIRGIEKLRELQLTCRNDFSRVNEGVEVPIEDPDCGGSGTPNWPGLHPLHSLIETKPGFRYIVFIEFFLKRMK
jgi:hypothetical protein